MNHLHDQTSPYLLQHSANPVEWYPWGPEALERAKHENKPILLSIGYSACHWCHVMAHESFEDKETAAIMNQHFINIKVDREERPDLDKIYQTAQQLLNQHSGGWPLTAFLSPGNQVPFFIGTYFPKEAHYGLPAFKKLLQEIVQYFHSNHEEITQHNAQVQRILDGFCIYEKSTDPFMHAPFELAYHALKEAYDPEYGGFTDAPKFPHPTYIEQLFHYYFTDKNLHNTEKTELALSMAIGTLNKMASGGIYDQLGGGFFRYSVDQYWMIPHFEKMLYDNAALLPLYNYAWQITQDPLFKQIAFDTANWILRDMQSPEGGYYSALDADSEGVEGKTYYWQPSAVKALLSENEYIVIEHFFGLDKPENFEHNWHLYVCKEIPELAKKLALTEDTIQQVITSAKIKLFAARQQRIQPACDNKILTSWNGLMIKGLAIAGRILNRDDLIHSAQAAVNFIQITLWQNNRLLATYKDKKAHLNAYLDDYALLIQGILALLETRWNNQHFNFALQLTESMLNLFHDAENGGFYFTSHDHETLIQRNKPLIDDAMPSGNGVAALVLIRLGHLLGEPRYLAAAEDTLKMAWQTIKQSPHVYGSLLFALEEILAAPEIIILCVPNKNENEANLNIQAWQAASQQTYHPHRMCITFLENQPDLHPTLAYYRCIENKITAYVCQGTQCSAPMTDLQAFVQRLA